MEGLSQTALARLEPRPWTDKDQQQAELLQSHGYSYLAISEAMARHVSVVYSRLTISYAERKKLQRRASRKPNPPRQLSKCPCDPKLKRQRYRASDLRYREANRERIRQKVREWQKKNPDKVSEQNRRRSAIRRAAHKVSLSPLTVAQKTAQFALFDNTCAYCGIADRLSVDHILPLSHGGLDELKNVVPACPTCNSSKSARPVEEWYRQQPFFSEARWRKIQRHCPAAVAGQLPLALCRT